METKHNITNYATYDLKLGKLSHQDVGQMDMYVRMYEDKIRGKDDNPTIGLILCTEKDEIIAKYSVLQEDKQIFAAKYQLYLPTEQELVTELARENTMLKIASLDQDNN